MPIKYWDLKSIKEDIGKLELSETELSLFELVKVKHDWNCIVCKKKINKNNYCLGAEDIKICIDCSERFITTFTDSLDNIKDNTLKKLEKLKANLEEIKKTNLANSL